MLYGIAKQLQLLFNNTQYIGFHLYKNYFNEKTIFFFFKRDNWGSDKGIEIVNMKVNSKIM